MRHEPDPAVGGWIGARLAPYGADTGTRVGHLVPRGLAAYARVLHRASDGAGGLRRWADVAAAHGTVVHPLAQFWRLVRWTGEPWAVQGQGDWGSMDGQLDAEQLPALLDVLAAHTDGGADAEVIAALWEGYGWIQGGGAVSVLSAGPVTPTVEPPPPAFGREVMAAPRLELPGRAYLLFRGPMRGVQPFFAAGQSGFWGQTPNLLWPADRTWCVATEIDLDSTVVGGPRALVDAVLADPVLEAFEVHEDDSLHIDGDTVNR
ncbi:hypothetical protein N867_05840 [Actinotalea fermentans ATCC 43279 = JCM 9966 = DSM 3133]|nr:hypothetical protein N867_05840 [Actinotalea fermentans ATCC 43279 = JCM 9966 = DSM 3133]